MKLKTMALRALELLLVDSGGGSLEGQISLREETFFWAEKRGKSVIQNSLMEGSEGETRGGVARDKGEGARGLSLQTLGTFWHVGLREEGK